MAPHAPRGRLLLTLLAALLSVSPAQAQDSTFWKAFDWRNIGPANMSGRITDVEGVPGGRVFYLASAAGGIWKTVNSGTSFIPLFTDERVVSMGDIAIAPSDTSIIWAGTGEEDSRNSISPGAGVYKSTDGGRTWQLMGLEKTQAIGRILIHPTNPDIVWVAALGAIWNHNPERGLYKTADGGRTWRAVKQISDRAGFVDIAMHPDNPDVLFASSWERVRGPYFLKSGGPGSALWKSTDGGETWTEVAGGGFPETELGRIGIAISPSNPDVMYTMVEAAAAEEGGERLSGLYRSADGGRTWERTNSNNVRPFYYSQVRVDPQDPDRVYWSSTPVNYSNDGGRTAGTTTVGIHVDHHAMWIDPLDPKHIIVGNDGGIAITWDRGGNWDFVNNFAIGQFYAISYGMEIPYTVCGGLQDNGSWCGPSRRADGVIDNHMWATINGGDGFYTAQDPVDHHVVYAESQGGNMARLNLRTGERTSLRKPSWIDRWRVFEDSILIYGEGDLTPVVQRRIEALRERQRADSATYDLRYNWNTPFFISTHDPRVFYAGANRVLKSSNRGDDLQPISPDLTYADTMKIRISTRETGGITPDATGAETYGTIVTLAESPLRGGWLYAGTDDGRVWMTRDDGANWTEVTDRLPGVPANTYVSRIEPSWHDENVFYVTFDGHRTGDFTPYVFMTTDGGRSFGSIAGNLPRGSIDFVHVIREDPVNPNLLFVGTDVGAYVSLDRGATWRRFMEDMGSTPVHDLKVHPRDHELIAGTHGRSLLVVDILPLQQMRGTRPPQEITFFAPKPGLQYGDIWIGGESAGQRVFEGENVEYGAELTYWIPEAAAAVTTQDDADRRSSTDRQGSGDPAGNGAEATARQQRPQAEIVILDAQGDTVQTLTGPADAGLHRVYWNFRVRDTDDEPLSRSERADSIAFMARANAIADSLVASGADSAAVARIRTAIATGDIRSLFRRGGRGSERGDPLRPGETPPAASAAGGDVADLGRAMWQQLRREGGAVSRGMEVVSGGGFFGGGSEPPAPPGRYTVRIEMNGQTLTQPLDVLRAPGYTEDLTAQ
ncbi:MAG TPA: hypothetical protein VFU06_00555 [Longimicrobiales bacterium]|nr:hypothetical protein [Longimicrobiales bacterium]